MKERHLYYKHDERSGKKIYLCYENVITPNSQCAARCFIDANGLMSLNSIPHNGHPDHTYVYDDLHTKSNIIDSVAAAAVALKDLHQTIPSQQIFTREMAK